MSAAMRRPKSFANQGAILVAAAVLVGARASALTALGTPGEREVGRTMTLGPLPDVHLADRPPVDEAQAGRIKQLIASLAEMDGPDFGLSPTLGGSNFAPLANQSHVDTLLLTNHNIQQTGALRDLVALGPDALPYLLAALDDKTLTKLVIKHDRGFGGMFFEQELWLNTAIPAEAAVAATRPALSPSQREESIASYTVTIGDVCFVAIGQIVGRPYQAIRYQPTAIIIINSPTHDPWLCNALRAIWSSKEPARRLFDSLLMDYSTRGSSGEGKLTAGWEMASTVQCDAALRLLYYFPKDSTRLIAQRLRNLNVHPTKGVRELIRTMVANGVRQDEFIRATSWSQEPAIRAAVAAISEHR
jgi:hypothetical protein